MTVPPGLAPTTAGAPASSTFQPSGPRPATRRRVLRALAAFVVVAVAYGILAALIGGPSDGDADLDTASPRPGGTMAIAQLLGHRGIQVAAGDDAGTALAQAAGSMGGSAADETVVIVHPGRLDEATLGRLSDHVVAGADVVLVTPGSAVLDALRLPVGIADDDLPTGAQAPDCPLPEATAAGSVRIAPSTIYEPLTGDTAATATFCYPAGSKAAALVVAAPAGAKGRFVLLGGSAFLTNQRLDQDGNAALALGLLALHPRLDWVIQRQASQEPVAGKSATHLLGRGFWLTCLQLLIVLVLLALWRGRRLGPPVPEPLPVVVRAAETTEGRGRLYAAARARDLAAEALRAGLRARLADRLGVPPHGERGSVGTVRAGGVATEITGPDPGTLVASVAGRTGRPGAEIWVLLYGSGAPVAPGLGGGAVTIAAGAAGTFTAGAAGGPEAAAPPPELDDAALLRLTEALDDLERQVGGR